MAKLLVIVPTRNRSALAASAINSVLGQGVPDVRVLVSDNSTSQGEKDALAKLTAGFSEASLIRVAPKKPLSMTGHWEWAIRAAMDVQEATHFLVLTDRMLFRPKTVSRLVQILDRYPADLISYNHDRVEDASLPIRVYRNRWSGNLIRVQSQTLLALSSKCEIHPAIPRMLNSAAPRHTLNALKDAFGSVFSSISPDFCFAYRCLATLESLIYVDEPFLVHYASDRSNGASYARGIDSADSRDFQRELGGRPMNYLAPIPQLHTVLNAIVHEYAYVKKESGSDKFPDLDLERYLQTNAELVSQIQYEPLKMEMASVLNENGVEGVSRNNSAWAPIREALAHPASFSRAILRRTALSSFAKPIWIVLSKVGLGRRFGPRLEFDSLSEALTFATYCPRRRERSASHLRCLAGSPLP